MDNCFQVGTFPFQTSAKFAGSEERPYRKLGGGNGKCILLMLNLIIQAYLRFLSAWLTFKCKFWNLSGAWLEDDDAFVKHFFWLECIARAAGDAGKLHMYVLNKEWFIGLLSHRAWFSLFTLSHQCVRKIKWKTCLNELASWASKKATWLSQTTDCIFGTWAVVLKYYLLFIRIELRSQNELPLTKPWLLECNSPLPNSVSFCLAHIHEQII